MSTLSASEALLVEHLRYTPLSLIDDVINTINAIVYRAVTAIETGLLDTKPASLGFDQGARNVPVDVQTPACDSDDPDERQRVEVEEGVHRLETLLEATVDKTFDKFEIYTLRNILHVPEALAAWVRLRHYEGIDLPPSKNAATPDSITQLRRKLQATQQLNLTLSHTHASNEQLLNQLRSTLTLPSGQLSHLFTSSSSLASTSATAAATPSPSHTSSLSTPSSLQPTAQFTKSQLPALKSLLDDLRPRLASIAELAQTGARPGQHADDRDQRVRYVEEVVDRVVATQLGATRDADDLLGQRRAEDEVRALERVAAGTVRGAGTAGRGDSEDHEMADG